jgi:CRISP-associated protein Cas1
MSRHTNTLFVVSPERYVGLNHLCLEVRAPDKRTQIPLHHLASVVIFGYNQISAQAMAACAARGISVAFMTENGRFLARVEGRTSTNVLLRRQHFRSADSPAASADLARAFLAGKLANSRNVLRRAARDREGEEARTVLTKAADQLSQALTRLRACENVDKLRGIEGEAAGWYFGCFGHLIVGPGFANTFVLRSRRPPRDPINALLSFLYTLLLNDVRSALESVGLDPQVGFLHVDRPGRPSLALDLMEEFRPTIADRLALSLVNRSQLQPGDFEIASFGAHRLIPEARKAVLIEYQKRKATEVHHRFLNRSASLAECMFLQARLLARTIRAELDIYPPLILE